MRRRSPQLRCEFDRHGCTQNLVSENVPSRGLPPQEAKLAGGVLRCRLRLRLRQEYQDWLVEKHVPTLIDCGKHGAVVQSALPDPIHNKVSHIRVQRQTLQGLAKLRRRSRFPSWFRSMGQSGQVGRSASD
jgi:hypothetical protein